MIANSLSTPDSAESSNGFDSNSPLNASPEMEKNLWHEKSQRYDAFSTSFEKLALRGCEIAEEISKARQKTPCFNKLDSVCVRLAVDLKRKNNVVSNINSQGIAWALKDLIFVFTRIVSSWTILRNYVYDGSNSLNRFREMVDSSFFDNFMQWQYTTYGMMESLIKSCENLNFLAPKYQQDTSSKQSSSFNSSNVSASEKFCKANGDYVKPGIYHPPTAKNNSMAQINLGSGDFRLLEMFNENFNNNNNDVLLKRSEDSKPLHMRAKTQTIPPSESLGIIAPIKILKHPRRQDYSSERLSGDIEEFRPRFERGDGDFNRAADSISCLDTEAMQKLYCQDSVKIKMLLKRIFEIPEAIHFQSDLGNVMFSRDPLNLTVVLQKVRNGEYARYLDVLMDLKKITENAKMLLHEDIDNNSKDIIYSFVRQAGECLI